MARPLTMDLAGFWALIEAGQSGRVDRTRWLTARLTEGTTASIEDFAVHLDELHARADTFRLWGAAAVILDGRCSDDSFWYFQAWLVGLGPEIFDRAVADPDTLAGVPAVRSLTGRPRHEWGDDAWPGWEELAYVADEAHEIRTGSAGSLHRALDDRGHYFRSSPAPADETWDFADPAEYERRYPALSRLFR